MKIKVNGSEVNYQEISLTVSELLTLNQVTSPEMVSVQLNQEFINKDQLNTASVKDGDEVDFLYFMGGGSRRTAERRAE